MSPILPIILLFLYIMAVVWSCVTLSNSYSGPAYIFKIKALITHDIIHPIARPCLFLLTVALLSIFWPVLIYIHLYEEMK